MQKAINICKKIYIMLFIIITILCVAPFPTTYSKTSSEWYDSGSFRETTYYRTLAKWEENYQKINNVDQSFTITNGSDLEEVYDEELNETVYLMQLEQFAVYNVNVSQDGLYYLFLDYKIPTTYTTNPTIDVYINGEIEYNELEDLKLNVSFESVERDEENKYNKYNDELIPYSYSLDKWYHESITDVFYEDCSNFMVLLKEGTNEIKIRVHDEMILSKLYIKSMNSYKTYDEYINNYSDANHPKSVISIQGEDISYKNDIEIRPGYYKSYKMTPASYKSQVLNMLEGTSMSRAGTKVTYTFNVSEDGLYQLSFKYKQSKIAGLAVGKNIYIDGEIPFEEFFDYLFPYQKKWANYTLNKDGKPLEIYLTKGEHTITLESTSHHVCDTIDILYSIMDSINSIGITINTITGSSDSTAITWKIVDYLPNLSNDLNQLADELMAQYDYINSLNPTSKEASEVSTLKIASKTLKRLAKSPNKIQNRLNEFSEGSGSCYQLIGSAIGYLIDQTMDVDYFCFNYQSYKMPSANGNIFGRIWFSIKSFFYSFFDKRYNVNNSKDADTIDVLVSASSLYSNIMQEIIDDEFTKNTGIKVRLNILSNTQSIVLNNATNTNPDAILDLDSWVPYTYALRGMLEDLSKYEGFDNVTKDIYSSNFTPLIFEDGVYGIPSTQGMQLMFYRTDILSSIGLTAPNTWEDVLKMLPTLQSFQMNFFHPLGSDSAYKGFGLTSQFFYMFGSEVYTENGFTTNINSEKSVQAIQYMTDLFTIYNLPQQVASFFEHFRSGTLPIGIAGIDMYLQLKYACPELSGQWGVLPIPGVENTETGDIERWTSTYGKCSIMFKASTKKDATWEFLKWWHQPEVQTEYVQKIKMYLGERYLIVPANIEALKASPWDQKIRDQIIDAAKWSRIPAITPGSYIIEREISNIWNDVVISKQNVRIAINQSVPKINRELRRKFEEFKYLKNGEIIKEYVVPMNSNIYRWVKGKDYYDGR